MKPRVIFCLIVLLILSISGTNAQADQWATAFDIGLDEQLRSVYETSDGGFIFAGSTWPWPGSRGDFWIMKVNADATVDWQKIYGGNAMDQCNTIFPTPDGGYFVGGQSMSFGAGGVDFWLLKLNVDKSVAWQKTYGGSSTEWFTDIQETKDGGYIAAGSTHSFGAGPLNIWVIKLGADGNIIWEKTYGGSGSEEGGAIYPATDGGFIVLGYTDSFGSRDRDIWVLKLSSNGSVSWQTTYGESGREEPQSIRQT